MADTIANSKRIAKNAGYLYIRLFIVTIINLIISRIVLKALGFEDFGLYSVVGSMVVLFGFLSGALRQATARYLSVELGKEDNEGLNQVFSMAINCHLILAGILWVIIEGIGIWYIQCKMQVDPSRLWAVHCVFQFSLLTFITNIIQAPFDANIVAHEQMRFYATVSIVEALLKLGVACALLVTPFDRLISYAALIWVSALIVCACYVLYNRIKLPHCQYLKTWNGGLVKQFASYSGWSLFVNAADTGVMQLRAIFFQTFLGAVANAALGIANQVFNATCLIFGNFSTAFHPQIVKSYAAGDKDYFMKLIFTTSKIAFFLFLLPAVPLLLNLPFVLKIWLGDYPPLTAEYITAMFIFAFFDTFQAPLWHAVYATGKIRTHQIMMGTIKLLVIPLMWWVLSRGDNGQMAILIWAIGNMTCAVVRTIYCHYLIDLDLGLYVRRVIVPMIVVSVIAVPLPLWMAMKMESGWGLLIGSTALSVGLIIAAGLFVGLTKNERQIILSYTKK
ncbi:MAG: hypothetical protein MJZ58_02970 [Paludibacteraceae bacterium]|nr:hypothetical protein [Paludibacteraceae bacterium]